MDIRAVLGRQAYPEPPSVALYMHVDILRAPWCPEDSVIGTSYELEVLVRRGATCWTCDVAMLCGMLARSRWLRREAAFMRGTR